jgi:hypothetical protein
MPIPIKKIHPSPPEQEEESSFSDSSLDYDLVTGQVFMYERITAARMLRILRSMSQSDQVSSAVQQCHLRSIESKQAKLRHHAVGLGGQLSAVEEEEFADDGVFVLDDIAQT